MRIRLATLLLIPLALSLSCGKKDKKDTEVTPEVVTPADDPNTIAAEGAVLPKMVPFADGATTVQMAGQLLLADAALTAQKPDKVLAVPFVQGTVASYGDITNYADIKTLDINADTGRFTVDLPRVDPYLAVIDELIAAGVTTWTDMVDKLPFGMVMDFIGVAAADMPAALAEFKTKLESGYGRTWMLVGYNSAGTLLDQANSMRFIGLPTATAGTDLRILVPSLFKGNLSLGNIGIGTGTNASAELVADSTIFNLTDSAISEIAWVSESLKNMKNAFMNVNVTDKTIILPVIMFSWEATGFAAKGVFTSPAGAVYKGYHPRVTTGNFPRITAANLCSSTAGHIKLYPPAAVTNTYAQTMDANHPFLSAGTGASEAGSMSGSNSCDNHVANQGNSVASPNFYAGFFDTGSGANIRHTAELEWSGDIVGAIPAGMWTVKYDTDVIGQFDMALASPVDANAITRVYVPSISFEADAAGTGTAVAVKLNYQSADGVWHEVSDLTAAGRFVSTMEIRIMHSSNKLLGDSSDGLSEKMMVKAGESAFRVEASVFKNGPWKVPGSAGDKAINQAYASFDLFGQKYSFSFKG